ERPRAIGIHFDIEHLLAEDGPALAPHAVGQRLDQPERIEAIAVLGKEDAFRKKWRQCRLVLPELFSREHLDAGAMTPAQLPTERIAPIGRLGLVDVELALPPDRK